MQTEIFEQQHMLIAGRRASVWVSGCFRENRGAISEGLIGEGSLQLSTPIVLPLQDAGSGEASVPEVLQAIMNASQSALNVKE